MYSLALLLSMDNRTASIIVEVRLPRYIHGGAALDTGLLAVPVHFDNHTMHIS
jgi:hypothetical protein